MRHALALSCCLALVAITSLVIAADTADKKLSADKPLMALLNRFTAPDVPALGPQEEAVPDRKFDGQTPANLPGKGLGQHPMLYIGEGYNKMYLVNDGKVIWTYSTGRGNEYDDVWLLSNGNILFTRMQYIAEITPQKEVVWRYDAPKDTEIHGCQPIGLDKVLFVQNGLPPKLKVVNVKTGATEVEHDLPCKEPYDQKTVHPQFRRIRYTKDGTYLVPFLNMGKVVEYDKDFQEIWSYPDPATWPADQKFSPWAAIRLKNGNTLITNESGKSHLEVTPDKKIVWQIKPEDLPEEHRYINTQTCTRLANGNTIICSRGANGKAPQLVEVTPDKKVVWVLQDWANLGPATAVQVLDEPGLPEVPGDSEH
jgi:outer membrane protein assembly factor BamB